MKQSIQIIKLQKVQPSSISSSKVLALNQNAVNMAYETGDSRSSAKDRNSKTLNENVQISFANC